MSVLSGLMAVLTLAGLACPLPSPSSLEEGVSTRLQLSLTADYHHTQHGIGKDYPSYLTVLSDLRSDIIDLTSFVRPLGSDPTTSTAAGVVDISTSLHYNGTVMEHTTGHGSALNGDHPDVNWLSLSITQDHNDYISCQARLGEYVSTYSVTDHSIHQSDSLPHRGQISAPTSSPGMNQRKRKAVHLPLSLLDQENHCGIKDTINPVWLCLCGKALALQVSASLDAHLSSNFHRLSTDTDIESEQKAVEWFYKHACCFCNEVTKSCRKPQQRAHISSARHLIALYIKLGMDRESPNPQECPLGCKARFDIIHQCHFKYDPESQNQYVALLHRVVAKLMELPGAEDIGQRAFISAMTPPRYNARGKFIQEHDDVEIVLQSIKHSIAADPESCRYTVDAYIAEKRLQENNTGSTILPVISESFESQAPL